MLILLMEEILHHLGCIKLVNSGIDYISTGAGFLPSTVVLFAVLSVLFSGAVDVSCNLYSPPKNNGTLFK